MKIFAASDLHGYHDVYRWLVKKIQEKRVDSLILAGDLLGCPDVSGTVEDAQAQDASEILEILQEAEVPVYYIMGNDDLVELHPPSDQFIPLHGRRVELLGANLIGYQYSLPFMGGVFEKSEEGIRQDLVRIAGYCDPETIFVTHSPAYGVLDVGILHRHAGSQAILDLVRDREVRAHIHGHVHAHFGRVGCHFNVASGGKYRAMLINLETMQSVVEQDIGNGF